MYLVKIYSIYAKLGRTRVGFNLYSFCSNGHQDLLLLLIIVLGCFLLIFLEIFECEATDATFFEDHSVQQLQRVKVCLIYLFLYERFLVSEKSKNMFVAGGDALVTRHCCLQSAIIAPEKNI